MVIVGCGAGGATLIQRLARAGPAGGRSRCRSFWDPDADWVSDELGSHRLYWTEPRVIAGDDPVPLGSNNSGRGVGGSMIHYAGYTPRFHPSDFRTLISMASVPTGPSATTSCGRTTKHWKRNCRSPVSPGRGATPTGIRITPNPSGETARSFSGGRRRLGIKARVGPVAIANGRFGNRAHCIYRGFCLQGCKVNAKASPLITHVPDALAHGAEVRPNCMVTRVVVDGDRRATGVLYIRHGVEHFQRARIVVVAGYSIETPRLLLLSSSTAFPDGLCNDFGQVGRYVMVQGAPQVAGRFDHEVRMYKAPPPEVTSEEFYETDPTKPYRPRLRPAERLARCLSPMPSTCRRRGTGEKCCGSTCAITSTGPSSGSLCEFLPRYDNGVTLADETDHNGLPVARFSYSKCENDRGSRPRPRRSRKPSSKRPGPARRWR